MTARNWMDPLFFAGVVLAAAGTVGGIAAQVRPLPERPSITIDTGTLNRPPVAEAGEDRIVIVGESIVFNGSGSLDQDGMIVSYLWEFGDGNAGNGVIAPHVYAKPGKYKVRLTIVDDKGATSKDSLTVRVVSELDAVQTLLERVRRLKLAESTRETLLSPLSSALETLKGSAPSRTSAAAELKNFLQQVERLQGKGLRTSETGDLHDYARRLADVLAKAAQKSAL